MLYMGHYTCKWNVLKWDSYFFHTSDMLYTFCYVISTVFDCQLAQFQNRSHFMKYVVF